MKSIQGEQVGFDTNVLIFGVREEAPAPTQLLVHADKVVVYLCREVIQELHRNLAQNEIDRLFDILNEKGEATFDYGAPPSDLVEKYQQLGCKKGDAVIAAHLESAGIQWFVSENRHFLAEVSPLPFVVLASEQALEQLQ